MADECSFCADRRSTAIVRDDVILAHTDGKEMDLFPIGAFFRRKAILFDKPSLPQSQIRRVELFLLEKKVARSPCGSLF